jgi:hypothetical protein
MLADVQQSVIALILKQQVVQEWGIMTSLVTGHYCTELLQFHVRHSIKPVMKKNA